MLDRYANLNNTVKSQLRTNWVLFYCRQGALCLTSEKLNYGILADGIAP